MPVPQERRKNMHAIEIGMLHRPRWRQTLFWKGFLKLSEYMEFASSLEMVTALFTRLYSQVFLDGVISSRNSSVPSMHASAIMAHSKSLFRITLRTKAVEGSLKR